MKNRFCDVTTGQDAIARMLFTLRHVGLGRHSIRVIIIGFILLLTTGCVTPAPVDTPIPTNTTKSPPSPTVSTIATSTSASAPEPTSAHTPMPATLSPTTTSPLGPWEPLPLDGLPGPWVSDVAFASPEIAFVVAGRNVYRSDDGGATWVESHSVSRAIQSVAVSPAFLADQTVFVVDGASRIFRSTDGGGTWEEITRIDQWLGGASEAVVLLSISPAFPVDPTLWIAAEHQAFRSTDGGLTWEPFDPGVPLDGDIRLVPNPDYPSDPTLEAERVDPSPSPAVIPYRQTASAANGATLLLGTTNGLYRSADGGEIWAEANTGLPRTAVRLSAVESDGTYYGICADALYRLQPGGARWELLSMLPYYDNRFNMTSVYGMEVIAGADAPAVVAITTYYGLFISRDGGVTWEHMSGEGLSPGIISDSLPLLSSNFAESGVAYIVHYGKIYRTDDSGNSWVIVEGVSGAKSLVETPDGRLIALGWSAAYEWDPELGDEWVRHYPVRFSGEPTMVRFITDLMAVAIAGDDIYLSEDGGRSWVCIGRIELDEFYDYLISPRFDNDHAIYAHRGAMLYVSTDAGNTWVEIGEGLPACDYYDSPDCDVILVGAETFTDGYNLYAVVRHDFKSWVWVARAEGDQ